jgi:tetratricopeptide (TPR) repeat protein
MPSAFISHSTPDDRYVAELVQLVRSLGFDQVFNDSHTIAPDEQFWPRIEKGIRNCDAFVLVLSHASVKSYWVDREVKFARQQGKKIIPIRIDDCKLPPSFEARDVIELRPGRGDRLKIAPSRILKHSPDLLFGRDAELDALDDVWANRPAINVYSLVAWGGAGKTSLVAHWMAERLVAKGWPGVERYFDWSFYSQGTREQSQASADFFIAQALAFFGDPDPQAGTPWERGERLARLVRQHRTLLVLDGLEPLQYPPNSPQAGEFKDQALAALLQALTMDNPGLCVVTSREPLKTLQSFHGGAAVEKKLDKLPQDAALALLRHLQVVGADAELAEAWREVGGHALTLQLLGRFIAQAFSDRDIRRRREVHLAEADREGAGHTAMKVLLAYEKWLESAGPGRQRDLAVLRLTGLFDRPASPGCLAALRTWGLPGLFKRLISSKWRQVYRVFGPFAAMTDTQWQKALTDLEQLDLITLGTPDAEGEAILHSSFSILHSSFSILHSIDAHPLVREYFAQQLKEKQPEAFRAAHSRLFDHLCQTTEHRPATLAGLQPLYQAVAHGCLAGRHQEACDKVYLDRILRGTGNHGYYSTRKLGAIGTNLGAVAAFFEEPWRRLSPNLSAPGQAWLLNEAAYSLRALGRLTEAVEPMRVSLKMCADMENWKEAAIRTSNLSELEVTLGWLGEAVADGRRAVEFADRTEVAFEKMVQRTTVADALYQAGERAEARALFVEAERLQAEAQPQFPLLYSLRGFRYADLLLAPAERAVWQQVLGGAGTLPAGTETGVRFPPYLASTTDATGQRPVPPEALAACAEAERRATSALKIAERNNWLLDIALDHLTLARARLYQALLSPNLTSFNS